MKKWKVIVSLLLWINALIVILHNSMFLEGWIIMFISAYLATDGWILFSVLNLISGGNSNSGRFSVKFNVIDNPLTGNTTISGRTTEGTSVIGFIVELLIIIGFLVGIPIITPISLLVQWIKKVKSDKKQNEEIKVINEKEKTE